MIKLVIPLLFIFFFYNNSYGQISISIDQSSEQMFFLEQIKGERIIKVDSSSLKNGLITFTLQNKKIQPGMYMVENKKSEMIILVNEDSIKLKTTLPSLQDSLKIIQSKENKLWNNYISFRNESNQRLEMLSPILSFYPRDTEFYNISMEEFSSVQDSLHNWVENILNEESHTIASHFIKADMKPKVPVGLSIEEQLIFFKNHYFDQIDWNDTLLIYSNVLTNKITEYLGLYSNRNMSKAELEIAFSYAIDQFLPKSKVNDQMYAFCLDYLVMGFERYHFDDVLLHIAITYEPPERCENEERKSEIENRLDKYNQLAIGKVAPEIAMPNLQGETISLSKVTTNYKLVVFWASWCPHCIDILPKLNNWYIQQKDYQLEIYSVSLDNNKKELDKVLAEHHLPFIVVSEFKGWNTSAAVDYNVYATPTMFLLDSNNKILAKPITYGELLDTFNILEIK